MVNDWDTNRDAIFISVRLTQFTFWCYKDCWYSSLQCYIINLESRKSEKLAKSDLEKKTWVKQSKWAVFKSSGQQVTNEYLDL